jgi:hypothetical protein
MLHPTTPWASDTDIQNRLASGYHSSASERYTDMTIRGSYKLNNAESTS